MKKEPIIQDPNENIHQKLFRLYWNSGGSREVLKKELENHWKEIGLKFSHGPSTEESKKRVQELKDPNSESPSSQPEDGPQKE